MMEAHWQVGDVVKAGEAFLAITQRTAQLKEHEFAQQPQALQSINDRLTAFAKLSVAGWQDKKGTEQEGTEQQMLKAL